MNNAAIVIVFSCLILSVISVAESVPKLPAEFLQRPEFFSKMDVIENLEILETSTDTDLNAAATVADLPEVGPPEDLNNGGADE